METKVQIRFDDESRELFCGPDERLLYAALRQGIALSYECATGTCGNCRAKVVAGNVRPLWGEAPANAHLRDGEVLLCQSSGADGCVIDAHAGARSGMPLVPAYYNGVVAQVTPEADGLVWVELELDSPIRFLAGQFVLVSMPSVDGYRAYSPAHDGQAVSRLSLLVRRKDDGALSPMLCSSDALGTRLRVFGPLGGASVRPAEDGDIAVVVGGSGAGVALSILDWAAASGHLSRHRVDVVCGLRTSNATTLVSSLRKFADKFPDRVRIVLALSEMPEPMSDIGKMTVAAGLAHDVAQRYLEGSWVDRTVFVTGPPPMVQSTLKMLLVKARVNPAKIRYDSFS